MTASAPTFRTVEIRPPSARAEGWTVARAAFHIVYWSALLVSAQTYDPRGPDSVIAGAPSPFERRFQDLDAADQRLFRAVQEGATEAERRRSATGRWPSADELAREGVPPFTADPLDRARYAWSFVRTGTAVNYVGTPAPDAGREAFVLLITEPDPGTPQDPLALEDEVHHRLTDGTMIHVAVWTGPPLGPRREAVSVLAPDQGYKQVLATSGAPAR
jgi:hypothetical protein